jgi:hypothetical protein
MLRDKSSTGTNVFAPKNIENPRGGHQSWLVRALGTNVERQKLFAQKILKIHAGRGFSHARFFHAKYAHGRCVIQTRDLMPHV